MFIHIMISSLLSIFGILLFSQILGNYWPQSEAESHSTDWHCATEYRAVSLYKVNLCYYGYCNYSYGECIDLARFN